MRFINILRRKLTEKTLQATAAPLREKATSFNFNVQDGALFIMEPRKGTTCGDE